MDRASGDKVLEVVRPMVDGRIAFFGDELLKCSQKDKQSVARALKEACIRRLDLDTACEYRDIERKLKETRIMTDKGSLTVGAVTEFLRNLPSTAVLRGYEGEVQGVVVEMDDGRQIGFMHNDGRIEGEEAYAKPAQVDPPAAKIGVESDGSLIRPVSCRFCGKQMYYAGDRRHVPEVCAEVSLEGHGRNWSDRFYAHAACYDEAMKNAQSHE